MKFNRDSNSLPVYGMVLAAASCISQTHPADAACLPGGPYNNAPNTVLCDPGANETIDTEGGHDSVTVNGGVVNSIVEGTGNDRFTLNGGTISAPGISVDQNSGNDSATINGGTIAGTLSQGSNNDTYVHTGNGRVEIVDQGTGSDNATVGAGATIGTIRQGSSADILTVTGGMITTVDQGSFGDALNMSGGTIGSIDQSTGSDALTISAGTVTGAVVQGAGTDTFIMSGGQIESLTQGSGLDEAYISGGVIQGLFFAGDYIEFAGGTIGEINRTAANNAFRMWGEAQIVTHLNSEYGQDSYFLFGGTIGGNVTTGSANDNITFGGTPATFNSIPIAGVFGFTTVNGSVVLEGGDDTLTMNDGVIRGDLFMDGGLGHANALGSDGFNDSVFLNGGRIFGSVFTDSTADGQVGDDVVVINGAVVSGSIDTAGSNDTFTWNGGGIVLGAVRLGGGDDTATLANLTDANIGPTTQISGRSGTDRLVFDNVQTGGVARFDSWESIEVTNNTQLNFDGTLVLGDSGTETGVLSIDATSTLFGGNANGGIFPFTPGQLAAVTNSGRIDLTNGGDSTFDTFTIRGNYVGSGGSLLLNTVLGGDSSQSDRLVIDGGAASGTTGMSTVNVGGSGDATAQDGIMVVQATNGGTTAPGAFSLNGRVAAGAYEYYLFKGGVTGGTEENWYLRSTLAPSPVDPDQPTNSPIPAPGAPALPSPVPGGMPIPLYRIEVPTYAVLPPVAHHLAFSALGTFHERRGEQALLQGSGYLPTSWGRVFGQDAQMKWDGTVAPRFDGNLFGFQVGQDLLGLESSAGHFDRVGLFLGHARMDGDVKGYALGRNNLAVGNVDVGGTSFGGYWTHIGPQGWYLDGALMGTWLSGDASADSGESIGIDGTGLTASLEGGYPIALTQKWTLEPQAQLIWQRLSLDKQADRFSSVSFATDDALTGRLGSRLRAHFQTATGTVQPYLKANLWHNFSADETVRFNENAIVTELGGTSLEVGGGVVASLSDNLDLFATVDYTTNLGGEKTRILEGNLGVSVSW